MDSYKLEPLFSPYHYIATMNVWIYQTSTVLDLSVFGPFKKFCDATIDTWMLKNPIQIKIHILYKIAESVG